MPLITYAADVPPEAWGVEHPRCRTRWPSRDAFGEPALPTSGDDDERLVCEVCDDHEAYGFRVVPRASLSDILPPELAASYTPLPNALCDHRVDLGLTAGEVNVVGAIWRHQHLGRAYPSYDRLAGETGLSESTVKRSVSALKSRGLLDVRSVKRSGQQFPNNYDLGPLWDALAALVRATKTAKGQGDPRPRVTVTSGPGVTVTSEVEEGEVEEEQVDPRRRGSTAPRRDLRSSTGRMAA